MAACITMQMIFDKNGGKQQQRGGEKRITHETQCSRRSSRNRQETATKRQAVRSTNSTARPHPHHSRFERFHYASRFALTGCRNRCMQLLHPQGIPAWRQEPTRKFAQAVDRAFYRRKHRFPKEKGSTLQMNRLHAGNATKYGDGCSKDDDTTQQNKAKPWFFSNHHYPHFASQPCTGAAIYTTKRSAEM